MCTIIGRSVKLVGIFLFPWEELKVQKQVLCLIPFYALFSEFAV